MATSKKELANQARLRKRLQKPFMNLDRGADTGPETKERLKLLDEHKNPKKKKKTNIFSPSPLKQQNK